MTAEQHQTKGILSNNGLDSSVYPKDCENLIKANNLAELFFDVARENQDKLFARVCAVNPADERSYTWETAATHVAALAYYLRDKFDVRKEQRIAILSATRYEWLIADMAILSVGAVSVPIYQTLNAEESGYILWNSDAQIVFAENQQQVDKFVELDQAKVQIPETEGFQGGEVRLKMKAVITFEKVVSERFKARLCNFWDIVSGEKLEASEKGLKEIRESVEKSTPQLKREDLASIVYTSGTTGVPKGVTQNHDNHLSMLEGVRRSKLVGDGQGIFHFLPQAHSFGRLIGYVVPAFAGNFIFPSIVDKQSSVFDAKQMFADVRNSEPHFFPSVPRLFEKLMTAIQGKLEEGSFIKKKLISFAIANYQPLAEKLESGQSLGLIEKLKFKLANSITAKIRNGAFGPNLQFCISGGAPLDVDVAKFFLSLGIKIYEGYGLTETTPALCSNTLDFNRLGSVGRAFYGCELKIAPSDGEIICSGGNIALGYFKLPQATSEVFSDDGWFSTGDIGYIDEDGYLFITDRKKDIIVNAGGKNIAPAQIEGRLKTSPYISQALVYGDKRPYLVALITLEPESIENWLNKKNITTEPGKVSDHPEVKSLIEEEVRILTEDYPSFKQPKNFKIMEEDFTVANGFLSPTLKLKRKLVTTTFKTIIDGLYES